MCVNNKKFNKIKADIAMMLLTDERGYRYFTNAKIAEVVVRSEFFADFFVSSAKKRLYKMMAKDWLDQYREDPQIEEKQDD